VLVLRYYEQLPDAEIAEWLGCAEATVRSIASRAFATLRENPQLDSLAPSLRKEA
jgi:DNA-directed RNA polymerase specialized sigma24 family protein